MHANILRRDNTLAWLIGFAAKLKFRQSPIWGKIAKFLTANISRYTVAMKFQFLTKVQWLHLTFPFVAWN